ncbi:sterol desaturase family protein [Zavarzinia sp.]|uniref:sterol desaturase family protein n=1 Tax=Zavarzinia sp. TaxID=2027920 RepID=UPI00356696B9
MTWLNIQDLDGPRPLALLVLALLLVEAGAAWWRGRGAYDWGETGATLVIALGQRLINVAAAPLVALPFLTLYPYRLFDLGPLGGASLVLLFLGVDFCYYWHHRAMHRLRLFWATHGVHHSTTKLNLSAAFRLGWGGAVTGGFLFYLPLVLIGFPPLAVFLMLGADLTYQLFLHSTWVPRLGPLEWVLNTPRHHHVHHAANAECRDRNFGGVLIVFDRLFGTFSPVPAADLRFGLDGVAPSRNPFKVALRGWADVGRRLARARSLAQGADALFGRP